MSRAAMVLTSFLLLAGLVAGDSARAGSFHAEVSGPDESAYVVSGLMVRDYVLHGLAESPLAFAEQYYARYPKVAIGHWPPLMFAAEAAWLIVTPVARASIYVLMAALAALPGVWLCVALRREGWPAAAALVAGASWAVLPLVTSLSVYVSSEAFALPVMLAAALQFGRFLDSGRTRDGLWFGVLATLACLTRPNGLALALVPPIALVMAWRLPLLRRPGLWWPVFIVAALAAPWYLFAWQWTRAETPLLPAATWTNVALRLSGRHLWQLVRNAGFIPLVLAGWALARVPWRADGRRVALLSLALAAWIFPSVISPHQEERHMVYALPPILYFAALGARDLGRTWIRTGALVAAGAAVALAWNPVLSKSQYGYIDAARFVAGQARPSTWLISTCGRGEDALIAEVALLEPAPRHTLVRASKLLATSDWLGRNYRVLAATPEAAGERLRSAGVDWIVSDCQSAGTLRPDARIVVDLIHDVRQPWTPAFSARTVTIYRRAGA